MTNPTHTPPPTSWTRTGRARTGRTRTGMARTGRALCAAALLVLAATAPSPAFAEGGAVIEETAGLPMVHATLAPDGRYTLVIRADTAWEAAELTVRGDHSMDLGAAEAGAPVHVEGWTTARGPLGLALVAVTPETRGVAWSFSVDPELVPMASPPPVPAVDATVARRFRLFDRAR